MHCLHVFKVLLVQIAKRQSPFIVLGKLELFLISEVKSFVTDYITRCFLCIQLFFLNIFQFQKKTHFIKIWMGWSAKSFPYSVFYLFGQPYNKWIWRKIIRKNTGIYGRGSGDNLSRQAYSWQMSKGGRPSWPNVILTICLPDTTSADPQINLSNFCQPQKSNKTIKNHQKLPKKKTPKKDRYRYLSSK